MGQNGLVGEREVRGGLGMTRVGFNRLGLQMLYEGGSGWVREP